MDIFYDEAVFFIPNCNLKDYDLIGIESIRDRNETADLGVDSIKRGISCVDYYKGNNKNPNIEYASYLVEILECAERNKFIWGGFEST